MSDFFLDPSVQNIFPAGQTVTPQVIATRNPTSADNQQQPGTFWFNTALFNLWAQQGFSAGVPQWELLATSTGALDTLSDTSGTLVTPTAGGNIQLAGTANQISVTAGSHVLTLALIGPYTPATYTAHSVLLGEGTSPIGTVGPTANTGAVLQNNSGADPTYSTATYPSTTTANDILYSSATNTVGQITTANSAALVTNSTGVPAMTSSSTNGQVLLGATTGTPAFGTLTTSTGVAFTTGAASLALDVKSGGFKVNAASTGGTLVAQNSYTVTQAAQTSFALPATANPGDMFLIASGTGNTSGWIITQGASQEIWSGSSHTTNGATGTLAGAIHTSVLLMCTVANTDFIVLGNTTGYTFT